MWMKFNLASGLFILFIGASQIAGYDVSMASTIPSIETDLLPYQSRLEKRSLKGIEMVVIHCTELPDLTLSREYAEAIHYPESGTGNSGHYYIERDGRIIQYVPLDRVAHHVSGHNQSTVGIELINRGRYPHWHSSSSQTMDEAYPEAQIRALISLLNHLDRTLPNLAMAAGHEQLDLRRIPSSDDPSAMVLRKMDPGPMFPWEMISSETSLETYRAE